jgi:hypothetical protein
MARSGASGHPYRWRAGWLPIWLAVSVLCVLPSVAEGTQIRLIDVGAEWRYLKGSQEASVPMEAWREPGFDDSSWPIGRSGFGYGDGDDATLLNDMRNAYSSVFIRRRFTVSDPSAITYLMLEIDYDDGFVAYINGVEVARRGFGPGQIIGYDALSTCHEAGSPALIDISDKIAMLLPGANVLAIQGHNCSITSSDFSLAPALHAEDHRLTLTRYPYVQLGTDTSMVVAWKTNLPSSSGINYGPTPAMGQFAADQSLATSHMLGLSGLAPDTVYYYQVLGDGVPMHEPEFFVTHPRPDDADFSFVVLCYFVYWCDVQ